MAVDFDLYLCQPLVYEVALYEPLFYDSLHCNILNIPTFESTDLPQTGIYLSRTRPGVRYPC